ncbi:hypothetical protein VL20_1219 [Microcystis panniformis FACHB-1757]|uniref:Uncharacterized protein n=1 Tax=Microcystis panniformis FACHB-1757 TaxID=1638788 RepID=A0A0K1RWW1_9CHRO|nr:hypothetical protein VL20_1219 [Microcystis panniformis FACHB-1757]
MGLSSPVRTEIFLKHGLLKLLPILEIPGNIVVIIPKNPSKT